MCRAGMFLAGGTASLCLCSCIKSQQMSRCWWQVTMEAHLNSPQQHDSVLSQRTDMGYYIYGQIIQCRNTDCTWQELISHVLTNYQVRLWFSATENLFNRVFPPVCHHTGKKWTKTRICATRSRNARDALSSDRFCLKMIENIKEKCEYVMILQLSPPWPDISVWMRLTYISSLSNLFPPAVSCKTKCEWKINFIQSPVIHFHIHAGGTVC